jgi:hypothetical protein
LTDKQVPLYCTHGKTGAINSAGECYPHTVEVTGSIPVSPISTADGAATRLSLRQRSHPMVHHRPPALPAYQDELLRSHARPDASHAGGGRQPSVVQPLAGHSGNFRGNRIDVLVREKTVSGFFAATPALCASCGFYEDCRGGFRAVSQQLGTPWRTTTGSAAPSRPD